MYQLHKKDLVRMGADLEREKRYREEEVMNKKEVEEDIEGLNNQIERKEEELEELVAMLSSEQADKQQRCKEHIHALMDQEQSLISENRRNWDKRVS